MASEVEEVGCTEADVECSTLAKECIPGIAREGTLNFVKAYSLGLVKEYTIAMVGSVGFDKQAVLDPRACPFL